MTSRSTAEIYARIKEGLGQERPPGLIAHLAWRTESGLREQIRVIRRRLWAVALVAGQLGRQDASNDAGQLVWRVAVVVMSTDRLSLVSPGIVYEDLGPGTHYRYRYSGLRPLDEITGATTNDDILNLIFSRFCIGK